MGSQVKAKNFYITRINISLSTNYVNRIAILRKHGVPWKSRGLVLCCSYKSLMINRIAIVTSAVARSMAARIALGRVGSCPRALHENPRANAGGEQHLART